MGKRLQFKKEVITTERVRHLLKEDASRIFARKYRDAKDLISGCGFTSYVGDAKLLFHEMESRERNDFLVLTYLGKMRNALRTTYTSCDLSNLIFLNRLNRFAELLQEVGGKGSKVMVAGENKTFDDEIFVFKSSKAAETVAQAKSLAEEFGMNNIEVRPLETFLGSDYKPAFERSLKELKASKEARGTDDFKAFFRVFMNATSPPSFAEALKSFTVPSKIALMRRQAEESAYRYMAFQKARSETDFWGINSEFMRSTVSTRKEVLTFKYEIGRLSPFQGMSIYSGSIGTEFLYDIICAIKGPDSTLPLMHYRNKPFVLDVRKAIPARAFA